MFKWKKFVSMVACAAMALGCLAAPQSVKASPSSTPTATFAAGTATGNVGETVVVPITLGGTKNRMGDVKLGYDSQYLKLQKFEGSLPGFRSFADRNYFGWAQLTSKEGVTGTVNATFEILKCSSQPVSISVTATYADSDYAEWENIPGTSGSVTINHSNIKTEEVAPTCTTEGHKKQTCGACNEVISNEVIPALGHDAGAWVTTKQTCGACNEVISNEVIPALGHDAGAWVTTKEPTCKEAGSKELRCTRDQFVISSY